MYKTATKMSNNVEQLQNVELCVFALVSMKRTVICSTWNFVTSLLLLCPLRVFGLWFDGSCSYPELAVGVCSAGCG